MTDDTVMSLIRVSDANLLLYVSGGAYLPDCHLPDTLPHEPSVPQEFNGESLLQRATCSSVAATRGDAPSRRRSGSSGVLFVVQLLCVRVERHVPSGSSMLPQVCSERSASSRRSSQSISELTRPDAALSDMSSAQNSHSVRAEI